MQHSGNEPHWQGSLERLRSAGCPSIEPVAGKHMPHSAILVLDHNAVNDVMASTIEALTGAGYDNYVVVPELALDFFDAEAKTRSKVASNCRSGGASATSPAASSLSGASEESPLRSNELVQYDKLQSKKHVLLRKDDFRIIVQRVDQYNRELLQKLNINPRSFDTRLYVLCALYFKEYYNRPTVIFTTDTVVMKMAAEYRILTCPAEQICYCGDLIERQNASKKQQHPVQR